MAVLFILLAKRETIWLERWGQKLIDKFLYIATFTLAMCLT